MEATTPGQLKGLRIITSCVTEDEFVASFHSHCDERSVFVPTTIMRPMGAQCPFSFRLADGTALLRGVGTVLAAWTDDDNPFGRAGIHLGITQLTSHSEPVFERLLIAREVANQREPAAEGSGGTRHRRAKPMTRPLFGLTPAASTRTEEMTAPNEELDAPVATASHVAASTAVASSTVPAKVTRQFGSAYPEPPPTARHRTVNPLTPRPWWMTGRTISVFASGIVFGLLISLLFRSSDSSSRTEVATRSEGAEPRAQVASSEIAPAEPRAKPPVESTKVAISTPAPAQRPPMPTPAKKRMAATAKKSAAKSAVAAQPARKSVAAMLPKPMVTGNTKATKASTAAAAKPTTTKSATTTKSLAIATAKPTTTKPGTATRSAITTKSPVIATAKPTSTKAKPTTTKAAVATKPSPKATTTAKPAAKTSVAVKPTKKSKRKGCASLDCL